MCTSNGCGNALVFLRLNQQAPCVCVWFTEDDRNWLERQLKSAKKSNKLLRAELELRMMQGGGGGSDQGIELLAAVATHCHLPPRSNLTPLQHSHQTVAMTMVQAAAWMAVAAPGHPCSRPPAVPATTLQQPVEPAPAVVAVHGPSRAAATVMGETWGRQAAACAPTAVALVQAVVRVPWEVAAACSETRS